MSAMPITRQGNVRVPAVDRNVVGALHHAVVAIAGQIFFQRIRRKRGLPAQVPPVPFSQSPG